MALEFFSQKDIENMNGNDVPEEFINYFNGLPTERQEAILESRPDLAGALGVEVRPLAEDAASSSEADVIDPVETEIDDISGDEFDELLEIKPNDSTSESSADESDRPGLSTILANVYEGEHIKDLIQEGDLDPLECLTIAPKTEFCPIHKKRFEKIQLKYQRVRPTFGFYVLLCEECNRLYIEDNELDYLKSKLDDRGITYQLYSREESRAYIDNTRPDIELNGDIYYPDVWIEKDPKCPIHNTVLTENAYIKKYEDRKIRFHAFYCETCKRVILRKASKLDLDDRCAEIGIPLIRYLPLISKEPQKKKIPPKEIKPDYYIESGERKKYEFKEKVDCVKLTEADTVVVSDSSYCPIPDHETDDIMGIVWVATKNDARKTALCLFGYCPDCQKYYMDGEDYNVLYGLGRPEINVLNDLDNTDYQITSGEVFDYERDHLEGLEDKLDAQVKDIKSKKDYVEPYASLDDFGGDYNALLHAKGQSQELYGDKLDRLFKNKNCPYEYRVDVVREKDTRTFYIGVDDINDASGDELVVSFNGTFGRQLVNTRTLKVKIDKKEYRIKLSRQFDIDKAQLFGYLNLRTDEDLIFREGITDPFLIKVLKLRQKQHGLVDIIATIQENQNTIVDTAMTTNLIVQGCAGSGKTMVLLHRLSALKYNNPKFDFSSTIIITPNEDFNTHIAGVADGLQVGFIDRVSIEQYYNRLLALYSKQLAYSKGKLASESSEYQTFVNYVYSDQFIEDFLYAYEEEMKLRDQVIVHIQRVAADMRENVSGIMETDEACDNWISSTQEKLAKRIETEEKDIANAQKEIRRKKQTITDLNEAIPEADKKAETIVDDTLPSVFTKIGNVLAELLKNAEESAGVMKQTEEAIDELEKTTDENAPAKIDELKKIHDKAKRSNRTANGQIAALREVFDQDIQKKSEADKLAWMKMIGLQIQSVKDDLKVCENAKSKAVHLHTSLNETERELAEAEHALQERLDKAYTEEAKKYVLNLKETLDRYTPLANFSRIYEKACREFISEHDIKRHIGTRRFDLYARLMFAQEYYGRNVGTQNLICVDEAQDVSLNEYALIYEQNNKKVIFNIFGDTNQLMKPGRGISDWTELKKRYRCSKYELNENYRNTNQITRFCNETFDMHVSQTGVDGPRVREIPRSQLEAEFSEIKLNDERIAVLLPRKIRKQDYIDLLKKTLKDSSFNGIAIGAGNISVKYVEEVKGIEFDKVYVYPRHMIDNEKYIAYTRALTELILIVDEYK